MKLLVIQVVNASVPDKPHFAHNVMIELIEFFQDLKDAAQSGPGSILMYAKAFESMTSLSLILDWLVGKSIGFASWAGLRT